MIRSFFLSLSLLFFYCGTFSQTSNFITTDIDNFWIAYDKIITTKDSALQYQYINDLYISKGTPGLHGIMAARRYTPQSYVNAINNYPLFWTSIRKNTMGAKNIAQQIASGAAKFKKLYPGMRPAKIYFTIGAFRTPGTTVDSMILIGSELAMADSNTIATEFSANFSGLKGYFAGNPLKHIVFLNVHEYVHTQQKNHEIILIYRSLYEGIAEFVAAKTMGNSAVTPAIKYGNEHEAAVRLAFTKVLYSQYAVNNWMYNDTNNEFNTRDLGYYVGYAVAEKYYNISRDKNAAIREMIELDYDNENAVAAYVDKSGYFPKPLLEMKKAYEKSRPVVTGLKQFINGSKQVDPSLTQITIGFSTVMDTRYRNFEFGPSGEEKQMRITNVIGFSEDGRSLTIETSLKPGKEYEIEIGSGFRTVEGITLKPYLVNFTTMEK